MNAMTPQMQARWRKMAGAALLWAALAALVSTGSHEGARATMIALFGFVSFALGLALFADGLKREIVAEVRQKELGG